MPVSEQTYERVALEDPSIPLEWWYGELREKPGGTFEHNSAASAVVYYLCRQLDWKQFEVRGNTGRVSRAGEFAFIPDVFVLPRALKQPRSDTPGGLEAYEQPLPLVVEVWSPSTGDYDVDEKLPEYRRRGDLEVWRIHPYERTLIAWRRRADGSYTETAYGPETAEVPVESLPGVVIPFGELFE